VQAVCDVYEDVLKNRDCVKLSDLAMNGNDLLALGVKGKEIGRILNLALKLVVEDPDMNEHDSLVAFAKHEIEKSRS
jgi:tRNA nucleotidyltransferase (CCA-adding enzyme)